MTEQRRSLEIAARSFALGPLLIAALALAACASSAPYNPRPPGTAAAGQVEEICRGVMGFEPSEPLFDNLWPGDPDPSSSTNNYRGCIASLSTSLQQVRATSAGAYPTAGLSEMARRERRACTEIGTQPDPAAFEACVHGLRDVLAASDMSALYRNP